ncbi:TPA: hypothetical protein NOU44_000229 [Salmonella enterica subsp. enterica serovar Infantis]|nr:hypothetical protein [Salmonella enterica subsp. enterica serovar Infantis]
MIFKADPNILQNVNLSVTDKLVYLYAIPWINWKLKAGIEYTLFYFGYVADQLCLTDKEVISSFHNLNEAKAFYSHPIKGGVRITNHTERGE